MNDPETFREVCLSGGVAAGIALIVFWRSERHLSIAGLAWTVITAVSLLFPAVPSLKIVSNHP